MDLGDSMGGEKVRPVESVAAFFDAAAEAAMSRCTACGCCVEACPTAAAIGLDRSQGREIVAQLMRLTRGEAEAAEAGR